MKEAWESCYVPRVAEACCLYGTKPIFVTLAPHRISTKESPSNSRDLDRSNGSVPLKSRERGTEDSSS